MAKKKSKPAKRRTREHVIADLSVNFVERQALLCGYAVDRVFHDYGIDLILYTYTPEGDFEPGEVYFQVKATSKPKILGDGKRLSFRIETADLRLWLNEPMPVILIVYDAIKEEGYWLYVQAFFQNQPGFILDTSKDHVTVHFPLENKVNPETVRRFAQFKQKILVQQQGIKHVQ